MGAPDLLVGARRVVTRFEGGRPMPAVERDFVLLELKVARNKRGELEKLTPLEEKWHREYVGWPTAIVGSISEAIAFVEGERG